MPSESPPLRRVLIKLSGEVFMGNAEYGIDPETADRIAWEIAESHRMGTQIAIVIGGGNIFRGIQGASQGMDRSTADYIGMLATVINALALQAAIEKQDIQTRVQSAINIHALCEPYIKRRAVRHLERGRVVIFAAGTGNPFFTTDTAAALRANEIGANAILKATKVDGVYDADPKLDDSAKRYERLTYRTVLNDDLKVMDATAISLCRENHMPIFVFDMTVPGNIIRATRGEAEGTWIKGNSTNGQ